MNFESWRTDLRADLRTLNAVGTRTAIHENLIEQALTKLWLIMTRAPVTVRNDYELLSETELVEASERRRNAFVYGTYSWNPPLRSMADTLFDLAVEIRALDAELFAERESTREDSASAYRAAGDVPVYILPRPSSDGHPAREGQAFERRGLRHHRILPRSVDGIDIALHTPPTGAAGTAPDTVQMASCVFPRVDLDIEETAARFHVRGLKNETEISTSVSAQFDVLEAGPPCLTAVWPELCISPAILKQMEKRLKQRGLTGASPLGFVVAGSWHDVRADGRINRSVVMDEAGRQLIEVVKRQRFHLPAGAVEDITAGKTVPVLVWGDLLVAFAICKDFCEIRHDSVYEKLDVDLLIVPSMGRENTMGEHVGAARVLRSRYGSRVFVVQQQPSPPDGTSTDVWGLVLAPPGRAREKVPAAAPQIKLLDHTSISCTTA